MFGTQPILFVLIYCVSAILAKSFKISMVSSGNSNQPALFLHGESPVWDTETQSLYFVDVHRQNVHRLDYATGRLFTKHIGYGQVNVVSLVADSKRYLVAVRSALYLLDWDVPGDAALRLLTAVDLGLPDNVINDGKPDSQGRFWFGTKGPHIGNDVLPDQATFYSISQDSFISPRVHLRPITISNGLTWALNNSVFYYIDSPTQKIEAFDFDQENREISGRRTILDISMHGYEHAIPDGMTIDNRGHLWVAIMFGGSVLEIDPDKRMIVNGYNLPVSQVTSLCWGGPNLDELFVTTSQYRLSKPEPMAGAVFTIRGTGSRGLPSFQFRFDNADIY
ncbi:regucalcin-like [Maniola jurtina]|uniref:regucalcin-like n=1 Tax=Maniola jurtina TaxID=191418 RepID=UPI001E68BE37|nr:regucalcin-like [Maniola jurtina]